MAEEAAVADALSTPTRPRGVWRPPRCFSPLSFFVRSAEPADTVCECASSSVRTSPLIRHGVREIDPYGDFHVEFDSHADSQADGHGRNRWTKVDADLWVSEGLRRHGPRRTVTLRIRNQCSWARGAHPRRMKIGV